MNISFSLSSDNGGPAAKPKSQPRTPKASEAPSAKKVFDRCDECRGGSLNQD